MKKLIMILISIFFTINIFGCNYKGESNIQEPKINKIAIKGTWITDSIVAEVDEEELKSNEEIKIDIDAFELINQLYSNVKYRMKVVDENYIVSYEKKIKVSELIYNKEKIEVFSGISNNNPIFELILESDNIGYLVYNEGILKVRKISQDTNIVNNNIIEKDNFSDEYYNSDVGIMLGLKSKGIDINKEESYRTLWISISNGILNPIVEKRDIIYPRINGIWKLEKVKDIQSEKVIEYFKTGPIEEWNTKKENNDVLDSDYKTINFVANDYIAIEKYTEDNQIEKQILSIGNINSKNGIELIDIYPKEYKNIFSKEYMDSYNNLPQYIKDSVSETIDYSNYTIKRNNGKWTLVSSLKGKDNNIDYYSNIYPNNKLLNFDTLYIKWKTLKGELPFIKDAYTSPTGRILIALFENRLTIYEIENGMIKGNPLANVELNNGEEVIMAEWATDNYVDIWKRAFSDGIVISEKED